MTGTQRWLADVKENADALEEARTKPHVLTDTDVVRIKRPSVRSAATT